MYQEAAAALKEAVAAATADQKMLDTKLAQLQQQAAAQAADAAMAAAEERKAYEAKLMQMQADSDRALTSERNTAEEASQAAIALEIMPVHTSPVMHEKTHATALVHACDFSVYLSYWQRLTNTLRRLYTCTGTAAARTTHGGQAGTACGSSHG